MKFLLLTLLLVSCGTASSKKEETDNLDVKRMERTHFVDRI